MKLRCSGIKNGYFDDKYGKFGSQFNLLKIPSCSIPVIFEEYPKDTKSFALILIDHDSTPVCGFSWIHWLACNIVNPIIVENASINHPNFVQGVNSWYKPGRDITLVSCFGGMAPPNAPHTYTLEGYALDTLFKLKEGFYINELTKAMEGHILAKETIEGVYRNK